MLVRWYWRRTAETLRYEGPATFVLRLFTKCLRPFALVGLVKLYRKDLQDVREPVPRPPRRARFEVVEATPSEADEIAAVMAGYLSPQGTLGREDRLRLRHRVLERFHRGWRCFVAKAEGEIIHYNWLAFDWADSLEPELGFFIVLGEGQAFCLDGYTKEPWRGNGVHAAVLAAMLRFLRRRGYRTAYTNVGLEKKSAWKTHERLQWDLSGIMLYARLRGASRTWAWPVTGTLDPFVERTVPSAPEVESGRN